MSFCASIQTSQLPPTVQSGLYADKCDLWDSIPVLPDAEMGADSSNAVTGKTESESKNAAAAHTHRLLSELRTAAAFARAAGHKLDVHAAMARLSQRMEL